MSAIVRGGEAPVLNLPQFARVIDLSQSISETTPTAVGNSPFRTVVHATYQSHNVYWREISVSEHYSTHVDAPSHFIEHSQHVDQIPAWKLVVPAVVFNLSSQVAVNSDYLLTLADIERWEAVRGSVPHGSIVILCTGWGARSQSTESFRNADAAGVFHTPGFSLDSAKFLVEKRGVIALGTDTLNVDGGSDPNTPVHFYGLSQGLYFVESLFNLEQLPARGTTLVISPLKLVGASGSPSRVYGLVPAD